MSHIAIRVENLSKQYQIGTIQNSDRRFGYRSLRDALADTALSPLRRAKKWLSGKGHAAHEVGEPIWALKDISLEIKRGEVVGMIGHNGAGKSTLLKILSRITEPTEGQVTIYGRVASLLEVGTGFHPELTGRENVYLNGAILGMKRASLARQFDQIVAFAEVEKFIDTPVKHYSSGMYLRLAFAVAAHLEPEILLVDEVLAVGDIGFQRKCLGKMEDVAKAGRTVFFVSHNMAAIKSLTSRCCVLDQGRLVQYAKTQQAINFYLDSINTHQSDPLLKTGQAGKHTAFHRVQFLDKDHSVSRFYTGGKNFFVEVEFSTDGSSGMSLELFLETPDGGRLGIASLHQLNGITLPQKPGRYTCILELPPLNLAAGLYSMSLMTSHVNISWDAVAEKAISFEVNFSNPLNLPWNFQYKAGHGSIALPCVNTPEFFEVE